MAASPRPIRIQLDLWFEEHTVCGTMAVDGAISRPFTGWLDVMAAIERLRPAEDGAPP